MDCKIFGLVGGFYSGKSAFVSKNLGFGRGWLLLWDIGFGLLHGLSRCS